MIWSQWRENTGEPLVRRLERNMPRDFLSIATAQSILTADVADNLSQESERTGASVETLVARKGLMSAIQMDVVQTLLRPTEVVPGYELLSVIGHGGMGVVYRAKQITLDRIVAIKTILVGQMSDPQMAARFEQEARAVARLQHPNIIAAIDFGQHDGRLFFVMELVEGDDLEAFIKQERVAGRLAFVTESLAWGLARQTASGLSHAAEQGIVHRDIKPANLLLIEPPAGFPLPPGMPLVKIADFGLAFLTSNEAEQKTRLTAANTTVGSPHYIAPEQLGGQPVDARADIYALGATLFHLLAGQPPYAGLSLTQILSQKLTADAPRLIEKRRDISAQTDALVAAMMSRQPEQRVASYQQLLTQIDEITRQLSSETLTELPAMSSLSATAAFPSPSNEPSAFAVTTKLQIPTTNVSSKSPTAATGISDPLASTSAVVASNETRWTRRRVVATAAGTALLLGTSGWAARTFLGSATRRDQPRQQLVPGGWSEPLFDGKSLQQWLPRSGAWQLAQDDDGATVLAGTNGVVSRKLIRNDEGSTRSLEHFALTLAIRLHDANAVELHFGILRGADDNGVRLAIRLERDTARLVRRSADRGSSQPISEPVSLQDVHEQPRVLKLVRDATHWFAFVDTQLLGALTLAGQPELAEFRLLAEAGPAWISDVEIEELRKP